MKSVKNIVAFVLILFFIMIGVINIPIDEENIIDSQNIVSNEIEIETNIIGLSEIPEFVDKPYIEITQHLLVVGNISHFLQ